MASSISTVISQRRRQPRAGALILVVATFASICLPHAAMRPWPYLFWSGVLAAASVPVVLFCLHRLELGRIFSFVFIPTLVMGVIVRFFAFHPFAFLAVPGCLWLTCLASAVNCRGRGTRIDVSLERCVPCGYDMTGNRSGACPECGKTIGPHVVGRVRVWAMVRSLLLWILGVVLGLGVFGLVIYKMTSNFTL